MSGDAAVEPVAAGRTDAVVDDGAVEVVISFPPIVMSVAEAEALRSGHVLEIGARLAETELSVQVGGRHVAAGYLVVLVEDRAGVMLSHCEG